MLPDAPPVLRTRHHACAGAQGSLGAASCASADYALGGKRPPSSHEHFAVARDAVGTGPGQDARQTLMIRNIPNKYTQKVLMQVINDAGLSGKYDFFYLPIDFKNCCNVGYAFINMATTDVRPRPPHGACAGCLSIARSLVPCPRSQHERLDKVHANGADNDVRSV